MLLIRRVIVVAGCLVGQPNFFLKTGTNSTVDVWPNCGCSPIFSLLGLSLTTPPKLRRSPGKANSDSPSNLRSFGGVVKRSRRPRRLKIGVQLRFGQTSAVEFVPIFQEKIWAGLLFMPVRLIKYFFWYDSLQTTYKTYSIIFSNS